MTSRPLRTASTGSRSRLGWCRGIGASSGMLLALLGLLSCSSGAGDEAGVDEQVQLATERLSQITDPTPDTTIDDSHRSGCPLWGGSEASATTSGTEFGDQTVTCFLGYEESGEDVWVLGAELASDSGEWPSHDSLMAYGGDAGQWHQVGSATVATDDDVIGRCRPSDGAISEMCVATFEHGPLRVSMVGPADDLTTRLADSILDILRRLADLEQ